MFSQSGNNSKWFFKKSFFRIGMWNSRPPPPSWKKKRTGQKRTITNIVQNDSGSRQIKVKTFVSVDIYVSSKKQIRQEHVKSGKNQYLQERRRAGAGHRIELS